MLPDENYSYLGINKDTNNIFNKEFNYSMILTLNLSLYIINLILSQ